MKKLIFLSINIFLKLSICRILQLWNIKQLTLNGTILEFGAFDNKKKNFSNNLKNYNSEIYYSNINKKNKRFLNIDLEKKIKIKKKFDNVLIFNVLEHIRDLPFSLKQISLILNKDGWLIGSTPFIYRVHGAPNDCFRYTSYTLENELKKLFNNVKVYELGYGPATAALSIIYDYTKFIPFLNNILIIITLCIDKFLSIFVKTDLKRIYPLAIFFIAKK
jgi:SAM-dependent methyltransferase